MLVASSQSFAVVVMLVTALRVLVDLVQRREYSTWLLVVFGCDTCRVDRSEV